MMYYYNQRTDTYAKLLSDKADKNGDVEVVINDKYRKMNYDEFIKNFKALGNERLKTFG